MAFVVKGPRVTHYGGPGAKDCTPHEAGRFRAERHLQT